MDLHPEDLLEREGDGDLSVVERARLDAHLLHCLACRMERRARIDFERMGSGPESDVRALVASLVMSDRARGAPTQARRRVRRVHVLLVAAALLALSGLAAAALGFSAHEHASPPPEDRASGMRAPALVAAPTAFGPRDPGAAATAVPPEEPATARTTASPPRARATSHAVSRPVSSASRPALLAGEDPPSFGAGSTALPGSAAGLFGFANAARRRGDHATAQAAYRKLIARYGDSDEARESLEVLGRMLLDDGTPVDALPCFEAYLRANGALAAEAMVGRATALERLGRADDERRAWGSLLDAYPDSLYGDRARARMATLGR